MDFGPFCSLGVDANTVYTSYHFGFLISMFFHILFQWQIFITNCNYSGSKTKPEEICFIYYLRCFAPAQNFCSLDF